MFGFAKKKDLEKLKRASLTFQDRESLLSEIRQLESLIRQAQNDLASIWKRVDLITDAIAVLDESRLLSQSEREVRFREELDARRAAWEKEHPKKKPPPRKKSPKKKSPPRKKSPKKKPPPLHPGM